MGLYTVFPLKRSPKMDAENLKVNTLWSVWDIQRNITDYKTHPTRIGYESFFEHIKIVKERREKRLIQISEHSEILLSALSALAEINTEKSKTLKTKITKRLKQISRERDDLVKVFNPTDRDHETIERYNNYFEFIGALKVHYDKPFSFEDSTSPEEINTMQIQRNQFCYTYDSLSRTRPIKKNDYLFKLSDMRKGWKYSVTFRCPLCSDERHAQYKPRSNNRKYKIPAHDCTVNINSSKRRIKIKTRSLTILEFMKLGDRRAEIDRNPNTFVKRYGTYTGKRARLIETESYRLGGFPTKQINHTNTEYAITNVTRVKRIKVTKRVLAK